MDLTKELQRLATEHPELQHHLRPILSKYGSRSKMGHLENWVIGPVRQFDAIMKKTAQTMAARIKGALDKVDPEGGWKVEVGFFIDETLSVRIQTYRQADPNAEPVDSDAVVAATLKVSASVMEQADEGGAFHNRLGHRYEFSLQVAPGVVSSS